MNKTIFAITAATSFVGTDEFELQLASGGASKKMSASNLRKQLFAGGTGFTATDPLNCGALAATTGAFSGLISASGGVQILGDGFASGLLSKNATDGLRIVGIAGSTNNWAIYDPAGSFVMRGPTGGALGVVFAGAVSGITTLATTDAISTTKSTSAAFNALVVSNTSAGAAALGAIQFSNNARTISAVRFTGGAYTPAGILIQDALVISSGAAGGDGTTALIIGTEAARAVAICPNSVEALRVDSSATATHTRLMIYDVDNGAVERVTVGVADSGGAGFKVLRIPN